MPWGQRCFRSSKVRGQEPVSMQQWAQYSYTDTHYNWSHSLVMQAHKMLLSSHIQNSLTFVMPAPCQWLVVWWVLWTSKIPSVADWTGTLLPNTFITHACPTHLSFTNCTTEQGHPDLQCTPCSNCCPWARWARTPSTRRDRGSPASFPHGGDQDAGVQVVRGDGDGTETERH